MRLVPESPSWPAELDTIDGPPTSLWTAGPPGFLLQRPRVAIVGTRSPTPYGEAQAARFARAFADAGLVVVSGMARGIDQCAHGAALDAGGATFAVLGSAVDRPWPAGPVPDRLVSAGLLLSEFRPGLGPRRHHFPLRNRIISGLAEAVVVIEAGAVSGSLITAHWAADQGRAVYALPGRVDHPMARGCHRLIREGAELVEDPDQVLGALDLLAPVPADDRAAEEPEPALLAALLGETSTANELAARLGRPVAALLAELTELELAGRVVRAPGGLYRRA